LHKLLPIAIGAVAGLVILTTIIMLMDGGGFGDERVTVGFQLADGGHLNISCEVADNPWEMTEGLQNREDLAIDAGMLFILDTPTEAAFIMPDMNFPLDIIFIAENGIVVNVEEADVEDPDTPRSDLVRYRSDGDVKWVVEINQGLSQQYGIGPGTKVVIRHGA
jgi:uncharacterized membrane protein (UPF0127 family)